MAKRTPALTSAAGAQNSWTLSGAPNDATARFNTGNLGLTGCEGGSADQYIDWAYATNAKAGKRLYASAPRR